MDINFELRNYVQQFKMNLEDVLSSTSGHYPEYTYEVHRPKCLPKCLPKQTKPYNISYKSLPKLTQTLLFH